MGDTNAQTTENPTESPESGTCDVPKPSIDILKEAKPSENIAINDAVDKIDSLPTIEIKASAKASTISDPTPTTETKTNIEELKNDKVGEILKNGLDHDQTEKVLKAKEKTSAKNKSNIFEVNADDNLTSTIFSIAGAPSKTIHQSTSVNSNKTASNDTLRSNVSKQSQYRNPLTGIGVNSNDEFKNKPTKRKDGNPLLGVGYRDDDDIFNPTQPTRIPPGGYSKGLW